MISLLAPPLAFLIVLVIVVGFSKLLSVFAFHGGPRVSGSGQPYACGEEPPKQIAQPDYSQFFPFAYFFTILHVVALMITTAPISQLATLFIALVYVLGAFVGLSVLYRR
jgi:NADH:ubiquinone oxidoreductase subunit 3 (subunit A)